METALAVQNDQLGLSHLSATICAELAAGLADAAGIKEKYELTDPQWDRLKINPAFRAMLKDALQKFQGDIGAPARIKMKAEILLEDSLPVRTVNSITRIFRRVSGVCWSRSALKPDQPSISIDTMGDNICPALYTPL